MTIDVAWLLVIIALAVAAALVEAAMTRWTLPRWRLWSWLMWSGVSGASIAFAAMQAGWSLAAAALLGLAVGVVSQPAFQTLQFLNREPGVRRYLNRSRRGGAYVQIGFWTIDLDDRAKPEPAVPPLPPKSPGPTWPARAAWAITAAAWVSWAGLAYATDRLAEPQRTAHVQAMLATGGFEHAQIRRVGAGSACWGGQEYAWQAEAGEGRACVRDGDHVAVRTDRSRWTADPFTRPAR